MTDVTKQQIEQVLSELDSLKMIINQNKTLLHQAILPRHFRTFSFIMGIMVLAFSLVYHFLLVYFGNYDAIPSHVKGTIGVAVAVFSVFSLPLMAKLWGDSLKKENKELSLEKAIESYFTYRVYIFLIPVEISGIGFAIYFYLHGIPYYVIPIFAIVFGLHHALIGSLAESIQWALNGYWFFATALFVAFNPISAPLAVGLTFGCGFLLFAVSSLVADKYHG